MSNSESSTYAEFKTNFVDVSETKEAQLTPEKRQRLEAFNEAIKNATPMSLWGEYNGLVPTSSFIDEFNTEIQQGTVDDLAARTVVEKGYPSIYLVKNGEPQDSAAWTNHQAENIAATRAKLEAVATSLEEVLADFPEYIKEEYRVKVRKDLNYCDIAENIGTERFTQLHIDAKGWSGLLDEESLQNGEVKMKYEDDAVAVLEANKNTEKPKLDFDSIGQALEYWQFSEQQLAELNFSDESLAGQKINAEEIQRLFAVMFKRSPQLSEWKAVIQKGAAISVTAKAREISIPPNTIADPEDVVYLPAHEFVHIIGGENGSKQPVGTLQVGMDNYLPTEEGKAVVAELIAGQKFGNRRQSKMAARYYAVALAMKTEVSESGEVVAKHSMQDIYQILLDYKIDPKDAYQTIWRTFRGTSLLRKVVDITTAEGKTIPVAEVYSKDAAYFEGQMKIFKEFMNALPLSEEDKQKLARFETRDVSPQLLVRVGRQAFLGGEPMPQPTESSNSEFGDLRKGYEAFVSLGKQRMYELLEYSLLGKINWDTFKENPEWTDILVRDQSKLVNYRDVVTASQN